MAQGREYADAIIETMSQPMLILDGRLRVARANQALKPLLHLDLLLDHVYIARRGYIALSMPISEADLDQVVARFEGFLERWGALIGQE